MNRGVDEVKYVSQKKKDKIESGVENIKAKG